MDLKVREFVRWRNVLMSLSVEKYCYSCDLVCGESQRRIDEHEELSRMD